MGEAANQDKLDAVVRAAIHYADARKLVGRYGDGHQFDVDQCGDRLVDAVRAIDDVPPDLGSAVELSRDLLDALGVAYADAQPGGGRIRHGLGLKACARVAAERIAAAQPAERRLNCRDYVQRMAHFGKGYVGGETAAHLSGLYSGKSRKIHKLIRSAFGRGTLAGISLCWQARQKITLRDTEPKGEDNA